MPTVCLKVTDEVRALWVEAASKELITLSEWLRRAADLKLGRAPEVFSAEEAKTVITEIDGGGHGTSKQVLQEGGPSEARLVPSPGEVAAEAAKKLMALAAGEEAEAGITTSQPEGVGHISQDAEGPTAQPSSPPAASASEELGRSGLHPIGRRRDNRLPPVIPSLGWRTALWEPRRTPPLQVRQGK